MNKIKTIGQKIAFALAVILSYVIVFSIGYNVGRTHEGRECVSKMRDFLEVIYHLREKGR